jgi:hypothetical protein
LSLVTDSRDQRDPETLGERYLLLRGKGVDIEYAVESPVRPYLNGQFISADPAEHHSKVDQTLGDLSE